MADLRLGAQPAVALSPGQHQGVAVVGPSKSSKTANATGATYPLLVTPSKIAATTPVTAVAAVYRPSSQAYPLVASTLSTASVTTSDIHGPYDLTTSACAVCHRIHSAQGPSLQINSSQSALCLSCHDGLGAAAAAYSGPVVPANDPAKREYYSHDGVGTSPTSPTSTTHTQSQLDEFSVASTGGRPNRHSECTDCHNPHQAAATLASNSDLTALGAPWEPSGSLAGVSGVSVQNSTVVDSAPAYTFLDGATNVVTSEYQLCFKCHSGFTPLTSNTGLKPSQYALDKGVEFNPANPSYHPVEAAGTNGTDAMKLNLTQTSPYKLWNFEVGSTIRCLNCHASSQTSGPNPPSPPPADSTLPLPGTALAPHTSANRGILIRSYKDRVLKSANDPYSAGDFGLCYVCHGEEPFAPNGSSSKATNFSLHSKHLTLLAGKGTGAARANDIDTPGDGVGNAICAECHFRIHSTTDKVGTQAVDGTRLVNFAPNVQPFVSTTTDVPPLTTTMLSWTPVPGSIGSGSCTLTCHGKEHNGFAYSPPAPSADPTALLEVGTDMAYTLAALCAGRVWTLT